MCRTPWDKIRTSTCNSNVNWINNHNSTGNWERFHEWHRGPGMMKRREEKVTVGERNSNARKSGRGKCGGSWKKNTQNLAWKVGWETTKEFGRQHGTVKFFFYIRMRNSTLGRLNCESDWPGDSNREGELLQSRGNKTGHRDCVSGKEGPDIMRRLWKVKNAVQI